MVIKFWILNINFFFSNTELLLVGGLSAGQGAAWLKNITFKQVMVSVVFPQCNSVSPLDTSIQVSM
jgi:hypothetical protein